MPRSINRDKLEKQVQAIEDSSVFASASPFSGREARTKASSMLRAKIGSERAKKEAPWLFKDDKARGGVVKKASGGRVKRGCFSTY